MDRLKGVLTAHSSKASSGSSGLLLRLFESHFFNVHLAVEYLKLYPNQIGITHYLIRRLKLFDPQQVEFYWPQLCYLVISHTTTSVALENFILERCQQDSHVAITTLWYLQSSLSDHIANPTSQAFATNRRLLNRIQSQIFTDPPTPSTSSPSQTVTTPAQKLNAPTATFVGIGMILAAIALPQIANQVGSTAIEQARRIENVSVIGASSPDSDDNEEDVPPSPSPKLLREEQTTEKKKRSKMTRRATQPAIPPSYLPGPRLIPSLPSTPSTSKSLSLDQTHDFLPSSPSHSALTRSRPHLAQSSSKPLTSLSVPSLHPPKTPNSSSTLSLSSPSHPASSLPPDFLRQILILQSLRTQLDLIRSLQDISTRLVLVPKLARLSALRAELTVLNHGLPRGCCLSMACQGESEGSCNSSSSSSSSNSATETKSRPHDRIVRISPSESVVLNSADRAPYVIHVEILEGDLDFDPSRRQNSEDLRRALREREGGINGSGSGGGGLATSTGAAARSSSAAPTSENRLERKPSVKRREGGEPKDGLDGTLDQATGVSASTSTSSFVSSAREENTKTEVPPETEVDLVEQLYGDLGVSASSTLGGGLGGMNGLNGEEEEDPTSSTAIQNRSVDEAAWATSSNSTSSKPITRSRPNSVSVANLVPKPGGRSIASRPPISLDDYASRMRMAAIMLSQLDAASQSHSSTSPLAAVTNTTTSAAGTLVGIPVGAVSGIGGAVGASLGAMANKLSGKTTANGVGQGESGTTAKLDTSSAATGRSSIAGDPPMTVSENAVPAQVRTPQPVRPRVLGPVETQAIREKIMSEMMALEEERMERMRRDGMARSGWSSGTATGSGVQDEAVVLKAVNKDDPSGAVFAESFAAKKARIRAASPYGHLANWNVISVIVKTGADLRQEQLAVQLIRVFGQIWNEEKCPSWVRYFRILVTSETSGLMETITDAVSVHSIKKTAYARNTDAGLAATASYTLYDYFLETYGGADSAAYRKAQTAFTRSLASYSVICYLLQLKDRHNGNILLDREGHLIHIDFGFMLSNSPGSLGFEMAPFKLPQDYIDILGGFDSEKFAEFRALFKQSFRDVRKHAERIITLVELMQKDSNLPCFSQGENTSQLLRERFMLSLTQPQVEDFADKLILNSATSSFTRLYDLFQGYSNGIL